ncbi:UNVERIFIED_CONTAM: hypothetical protein PYX00_009760 [Menopon gallinae]|uniref:Ig-like domain-containing protein n=1 Tax=Menopon gallinae TaxID=328185 RepID=A0AAW2HD10_9NEOP
MKATDAWLVSLLLVTWPWPTRAGSCPSVCVCKWKGGKQTVECLERALITIPENIDSETQVLDVSGNNLQIVPRETFYKANLTNLQKVYLKSCRIGQIGERAFRGLTNLVELDLSHNLLTAVPSVTFEDTPFLRYLSLANNPIQKIEANAFGTVTGISKIDLSHCEIQMISPNAFDKLVYLEWLKLNGNRLTELQPRTVETISKLHGIELHDNPWSCDCKLRAAKEWLALNNIPYPITPVCHGPERVAGRTFAELSIDDFACRPEVLPMSRYIEATTGENATVVCRVGAVPSASIHWYWNGRLLLNNSAFSAYQKVFIFEEGNFEKTSTLVLTNALETDSSDFYCVAENRAGTAEANFTLHVSLRTAGMASLGSGQIAGLSAALVILILAILMVALILLIRLRRLPFSESKTPGQLEVIATMNGNGITTTTKPIAAAARVTVDPADRKDHPGDQKHRQSEPADGACTGGGQRPTGNNPDIIRDAKPEGVAAFSGGPVEYPPSGWCAEPASPSAYLRRNPSNQGFDASDKTPIISEEDDEYRSYSRPNLSDYPPDYGLPIFDQQFTDASAVVPTSPTSPDNPQLPNAKTLRVWQRGVPVLPPATALKRVLANSRNSPDEGYQEGCGTDV